MQHTYNGIYINLGYQRPYEAPSPGTSEQPRPRRPSVKKQTKKWERGAMFKSLAIFLNSEKT